MSQRWKITIEYDGLSYVGWQRQKIDISVQQAIEDAIYKLSGQQINLHVAGRTDAGVHAVGQVAHFDSEKPLTAQSIRDGGNVKLYELGYAGVVIRQAEQVPNDFHARFSAIRRVYCYRIIAGRRSQPVLSNGRVLHIKTRLNVENMQSAANFLLGEHDFSSFRASGCQGKSPIKTIEKINIIEDNDSQFYQGQYLEIWVEARSFLYHQVRNITGSLLNVGIGKWAPENMKEVLELCDRTQAGATAPAHGLYFMRAEYSHST